MSRSIQNLYLGVEENKKFVLGLPTGSTPLGVYRELIKLYENNEVSFKNVITFNMDEYVGLSIDNPQSYHHFMYTYYKLIHGLPFQFIHLSIYFVC